MYIYMYMCMYMYLLQLDYNLSGVMSVSVLPV